MAALCGVSGSPSGRWRLPFLRPHYSGADRSGARARDAASEAVRVLSSLRRFPEFPRQDNASPPGAGGLRGGCDADPAFLASAWLPVSCSFSVSTWSPAVLSRLLVRLLEAGGISPPSSFPPSSFASASSAPASSAPFFAAEAGGAAQRASAQGEEGLKEGGMERMDPRRGRWGGDETRRAGRVASSLCPAVARASLQICRAVLFAFHAALRRSALSGDSGKLLRPPASLPLTPQQAEAGAFAHAQVAAQMARHFAGVSLLIADRPGDAGGAYGRDRGLRGAAAFIPLFRLEDEEARAEATHALAVAAESAASAVQRLATVVAPPSRARLPSPFFSRGGTLEVVGAAPSIGKRREMSCSSAETVFILGKAYSWRGDSPRERGGGAQAVSGGNKVIHEAAAKAESLSRDADEGGSRAEGKDALRGLSESLRLACDEGDLLCAQLNALTQLILFCAQVETPLAALAVKERAWDPACARGDKCRVAEKASRSEEEGKPRGDRRLRPRPACPSADGGRGASDGGLCFSHSEEEAELPAARVCGETAKPWEGRGGGRRSASAGQKEVQRTRPRPCEHTRQARRLAPAAPSEGDEADSAEEDTAERLSWRAELRSGFAREASRLAGLAQALKDRLVWLITAEALQMIKSHSCVLYVPLADVFGSLLSPSRLSAAPSLLSASLRLLPQCGAAVWDAAWTRVGQALVHAVLHTSFSSRDVSSPLWPFFARDEDPQVGGSASFLPSLIGTAGGPSRFPRALARFASTARVLLVAYFTAPPSSLAPAFAGRMSSGLSPSSPAGSGLHDGEARRGRSCFSVLSIHRSVALLQDLEAFLRAPADRVVSPLSHILKSHFPCFSHAFPAGASEESSRWLLSPAASLVATSVPPTPAGHSGAWGRHAAAAGARQNGSEVRLGSLPRASTSPWASCLPFGLECRRGAPTDADLAAASRADPRPAREDEERGAGADWGRWRQPERRARGASPSKGSAKLLEASLAKEVQAARVVESLLRCGLKAEKFAADLLRLRPDLPRPAQEAVLAEVCDALACGRRQAAHALAEARRARAVVETLCGRGDSEGRAPGSSCESEATWEDRQPEAAARGESTCARKGRGEKTTQASRSQPCAAQDGRPLSAVDQQPTANAAEMTAGGGAPSGEAAVQQWERTKETLMTVAETAPDRPATEKEGEEIDRSGTRGRSAHGGAEQRRKEARLSLVRLREAQAAVATMRHRSDASKEDRGEANEGDLTPAQRPGAEREEALHAWSPPHLEERDTPMAWSAAAGNAKHRDVGGDREARSGISSPAAKDEETSENGICESACSCLNEDTFSSSAGFPARSASDPVVKGSGPAAFLPSPCSMSLSAASPVSSHLASRSTMAALSSPLSVAPLPSPGGQARARGPKSPKSPFPDEHEPAASSASPASSSSEGGLPWCIASASPARRPPRPGPAGSLSSLSTTGCHSGDSRASTAEVVGPSPRRGDAPEGPEGPRRAEGEFRAAETQVEEHWGSPWAGGERGEVAVAAKTGRCSVQPGVEASKGASSAVSPALRRAWGWMWRSREENERRAKAVASSIVAPLLAALAPKAGGTPERMNVPTSVFSQLSFSDSEEDSATDPSSEEGSEQCRRPDFDTRSGEELYGEAPGAEQEGRAREKARLLGKAPTGRDEEEKHTWAGYPASAVLPRGRDSHVTSRRTHAGSPSWRANAGREEEEEAAEAAGVPVHFARRETRQSTAERDEACDFPRKSLAGFVWHRGTLPPGAAALLPSPFASFFAHMQASTDSPSPSHALALFLAASPFVSSLASSSEACGLPASSAEKEESGRWCAGPALPGATGRERLAPGRQPQEAREGATEEDEGLHRKWWRLDGPLLRISSCPSELFPEAALHLSDLCCVLEADEGSEATDGGREEGRGCQGCARCRPTLAATAASVARRVGAATQKRGRGAGEAGPADLGLAQGEQDDEGETLWHELEYEWVEAQEAVTKNPSCRLVLTFWDGVRAPVVVFFSSPRRRRLWAQTLSAGIASASACLWRRGISAGASLSDVASPGCFSSSVSLSSSSSPSSGGGGGATRSSLPSSCVPEMPPQTRGRGRKPIRERLARASGDGGQENGVDSWTRPSMGRGRPRASSSSSSVKETRQPFPRSASAFRRPTGPCFFVYSERPYAKSGGTVFYFPSPLFFSLFSKPASQGVTSSLPRPALDPRHPSVCEDRDEESASSSPLSASAEGASHSCVVAEALHQFRSLLGLQRPRGLFCTLRSESEARGASPRRKGGGSASWGGGSASWPSRERRASPRGGEAHAERGLPEGRGQLGEGRGLPRKGRHEPGGEAAESRERSRLSQSGARRSWGTPAPSMCLRSQLVAGGGESEFVMPDSPPRVRASELCPPHTDTPAEGEADSGWVFVEETLHRSGLVPDDGDDTSSLSPSSSLAALHVLGL
ncbi:hypothetical protein BESB_026110 [Besnoitia besnoiti]|uniref:Uncharacterized protein n=1 Tax=Besnoitia besnoiti TaxID=94643 RepID=A0A2A9M7L2_BESBE|nr:uncharacterized protein BESB_026110 [Besnoitia besnoiti]PFH31637.1 hypothetical protein BESB_026110 [Besnoitia besnoiti]